MKTKKEPDYKVKWSAEHYVTVYELAKSGMSEVQMAEFLDVDRKVFQKWKVIHPSFASAIERGRKGPEGTTKFHEFVFKRLPPHLQKTWKKLMAVEEAGDVEAFERLVEQCGKTARQHFFLYALCEANFNMAEALRKLNLPRTTVEKWILEEEEFADMMRQIHEYKKDFFESALIEAVHAGVPAAVIFANKTLNRDRGYDPKKVIEISGKIDHSVVCIEDLSLPLEVKKVILKAIQEQNTGKTAPLALPYEEKALEDVIDAEFTTQSGGE